MGNYCNVNQIIQYASPFSTARKSSNLEWILNWIKQDLTHSDRFKCALLLVRFNMHTLHLRNDSIYIIIELTVNAHQFKYSINIKHRIITQKMGISNKYNGIFYKWFHLLILITWQSDYISNSYKMLYIFWSEWFF